MGGQLERGGVAEARGGTVDAHTLSLGHEEVALLESKGVDSSRSYLYTPGTLDPLVDQVEQDEAIVAAQEETQAGGGALGGLGGDCAPLESLLDTASPENVHAPSGHLQALAVCPAYDRLEGGGAQHLVGLDQIHSGRAKSVDQGLSF